MYSDYKEKGARAPSGQAANGQSSTIPSALAVPQGRISRTSHLEDSQELLLDASRCYLITASGPMLNIWFFFFFFYQQVGQDTEQPGADNGHAAADFLGLIKVGSCPNQIERLQQTRFFRY